MKTFDPSKTRYYVNSHPQNDDSAQFETRGMKNSDRYQIKKKGSANGRDPLSQGNFHPFFLSLSFSRGGWMVKPPHHPVFLIRERQSQGMKNEPYLRFKRGRIIKRRFFKGFVALLELLMGRMTE